MRIALITTALTPASHAAVIARRWIEPLPSDADYDWPGPRTRITTFYVLQEEAGKEEIARFERHGIRRCTTIDQALTSGTENLTADAVMLIGEHGNFPQNAVAQKLYPRKELLDEVLAAFARTGKVAPIFFDKHFSWNPETAKEMYWTLQDRDIPLFGGSSLTFCPLEPPIGNLQDAIFEEVVMTTWGEMEGYLFHGLEILESVIEQRRGGESGVDSVIAWKNEEAWAAMDRGEFSRDLLEAALAVVPGEASELFKTWNTERTQDIQIFQLRYRDGLKATIVRLNGLVRKWALACRLVGRAVAAAPVVGTADLFYPHFARLSRRIEDFFLSGFPPVPPTRLYLTTLACAYSLQALAQPGRILPGSEILMPPARAE